MSYETLLYQFRLVYEYAVVKAHFLTRKEFYYRLRTVSVFQNTSLSWTSVSFNGRTYVFFSIFGRNRLIYPARHAKITIFLAETLNQSLIRILWNESLSRKSCKPLVMRKFLRLLFSMDNKQALHNVSHRIR